MLCLSLPTKDRHVRDAFTIIELIVVLVIIGVMSAVAVPRLSGSLANKRLAAAKRRIELDLAQTQQRARFTGGEQRIEFDIANSYYFIEGMQDSDYSNKIYTVELDQEPYNATITAVDFGGEIYLRYDGFGKAMVDGYIGFEVGGKTQYVIVGNGAPPMEIIIDPVPVIP